MPTTTQISTQLDRLARIDASPFPVVSLYLNLQPNQHGRDQFEPFLRKELPDRVATYPSGGPERGSLERDVERIRTFLADIDRSANGLALFSCSGIDLFDPIALTAPIHTNRLCISDQPHLFPLAKLADEHPRYAVVTADSTSSRILIVAADVVERTQQVDGARIKHHKMGGWAQARYQRHVENERLLHAKEVAEALERIVRAEDIRSIILAGNEVFTQVLRDQFSKDIAKRIVDYMKLDAKAPEQEILQASLAAMDAQDVSSDRQRVDSLLDAFRADGLAVLGLERTRQALDSGQVDELVIAGTPDQVATKDHNLPTGPDRTEAERVADELITKARQTGARISIIQDRALGEDFGGVGAFLRFRID